MAEIEEKHLVSKDALEAPLQLAKNLSKVVDQLDNIISKGKASEVTLSMAKNTKQAAKETEELSLRQKELEKVEKQLQTAQARNNKEYIKKRAEVKKLQKEQRDLIKSEEELIGTEEKLLAANKRLRQERKKINAATEEGRARIEEINEEIDKNTEYLKENVDAQDEGRLSVGQYAGELGGLFDQLIEVTETKGGIQALFKELVAGLGAATKAAWRFITTPIGAVIAALAATVAAFTAVVKNNQEAADDFNKTWEQATAAFEVYTGRTILLVKSLGQLALGDVTEAQKTFNAAVNDFFGAARRAAEAGGRLADLQVRLEKATIKSTTRTAELAGEIERLNIVADDATRSFAEREEAAEEARQKQVVLAKEELELAKLQLGIVNEEVNIAKEAGDLNRELRQRQADALRALIEAENEYLATQLENEKVRRELVQDRLERDLDILIDGFDNVKTINERIISNENAAFEVREKNLNKLVKLSEESFNQQISIIEEFAGKRIDVNKLLDEEDSKVLNARIRGLELSEIIEGRLLEIVRERRLVLRDLLDLQILLNGQAEEINKIGIAPTFDKEEFQNNADEQINDLKNWLDATEEAEKNSYEKRLEFARNFERIRKETTTEALMAGQNLFNTLSEAKIAKIDEEIEGIQERRDAQLEAAEGNEERQQAIRERAAANEEALRERQNRVRRRQAVAEKAFSIANVIIDTAQSISKTAALLGYPAAIPFVALAAATGAVQIATIASQPIPQFEKGTKNAPRGLAVVDEGGPELIEQGGKSYIANSDGPRLTWLEAGAKVYPHHSKETQDALSNNSIDGIKVIDHKKESDKLMKDLINETKGVKRSINKIKQHTSISINDKSGWLEFVRKEYY